MSLVFNPRDPVPQWRVGVFVSSSQRPQHVVMVAVGDEQIAEYEAHRDFVRWLSGHVDAELSAEYMAWIDYYHAGNGDYTDFMRTQEIKHG
jgi:uncharacterized NAD(P)/FAD-binding protein YdhS